MPSCCVQATTPAKPVGSGIDFDPQQELQVLPRPTPESQRKSLPPIEFLRRTIFGRGNACGRGQVVKRVPLPTGRGDCVQTTAACRMLARCWPVAHGSRVIHEFTTVTPAVAETPPRDNEHNPDPSASKIGDGGVGGPF